MARLEEDVRQLKERLAFLGEVRPAAAPPPPHRLPSAEEEDTSEEILSWVGEKALLPRIATLCFLLVVALALRTVTDGGLLDSQVGAVLGMVYACALMGAGDYSYRRGSPLAPVFTVCGTLLLCSVVVETHAHFDALPTAPAYLILGLAGGGAAAIGFLHRIALPVFVGTLGMTLSALAIDYPHPNFASLSLILLGANLLGTFATRLERCSWLRWIILVLTLLVLQVWGIKLEFFLNRQTSPAIPADMIGYLPLLAVFSMVYLGSAFLGILKGAQGRVARFDVALPAIAVSSIFLMTRNVFSAGLGSETALGWAGVAVALLLGALAVALGSRFLVGAPGTNAFTTAAAILFALAVPLVFGQLLAALPLLSAGALGIFWLGGRWQSGGVRVTSYLLQIYACGALVFELRRIEAPALSWMGLGAAAVVVFCGVWHYRCARRHAPPEKSAFFSGIDPEDRSAILLLLAALSGGFFALRVVIFLAMKVLGIDDPGAFTCYQSVLVNLSAIGLMLAAFLRGSKELRSVAILLMVIGGGKVLFGDMISTRGLPLVISVFSFGLAAAIESLLLGRWPRSENTISGREMKET
ncbi:DUF2339 domain-containing protein [Desulfuromonas soudanensis]|uniref:DUF2339 domain-containing protein n=1 Tax=Desulfuromonas soudanensis TaxID=1603606 RepID=UPI000ACF4A63|nr:DUF2339 domain-containing protein [Desulfuromonas soudanensis]